MFLYKKYFLLFIYFFLFSCASFQALNKSPSTDLNSIDIGNSKEYVESKLGKHKTSVRKDNVKLYRYIVDVSQDSSMSRAAGHAIMTVSTFGAWEVAGNILEANDSQNFYVDIEYDDDFIVKNIYKKRLEDY